MGEFSQSHVRPRALSWGVGTIASELTKGVLIAMGGLIAVGILLVLASFVVSALF
jgi:hypothetical protein